MGKTNPANEEPLVVAGHFNYSRREPKDRVWAYIYAAFLAFTVIGGIVTIHTRLTKPVYLAISHASQASPPHPRSPCRRVQ